MPTETEDQKLSELHGMLAVLGALTARDVVEAERATESLCVCWARDQHGSHLIGGAKCDCMCHASNQRKAREEA